MTASPRPPLVVVMGVSGCGKSTVGVALARRLGVPFADADDFHPPENIAKMSSGVPLTEADRGPWLESVGAWLAAHTETGGVASCSALRRRYRDVLRGDAPHAVVIHLHGHRDVLAGRVAGRVGHFMPATLLDSQLEVLERLEPDEAGEVLDVAHPVDTLVEQCVQVLGRHERSLAAPQ